MTIETYKKWFTETPSHKQTSRYATIFIMRMAESECIFRTDGEINIELTKAGLLRDDLSGEFTRVFMSKRKGIAPERRTGRALLRKYNLLNKNTDGKECMINENMCGKCIDCYLYGSAVGNETSLSSHVISDEGFDILPSTLTTTIHTFNALYESGTMRSGETGKQSQSIQKDQVIRSGTIFLDIETIKDVTSNEFLYVLANILRTKRYGAQSSRLGKMNNFIVGIVLSNCELISNLEWVKCAYDYLCSKLSVPNGKCPEFPINPSILKEVAKNSMNDLLKNIHGEKQVLNEKEVLEIINEVDLIYNDAAKVEAFLKDIDAKNEIRAFKKEDKKKTKKDKTDRSKDSEEAEDA